MEEQIHFYLTDYGESFYPDVTDALKDDLEAWRVAELFGVKPWEVDDLPLYWINRAPLCRSALGRARQHLAPTST